MKEPTEKDVQISIIAYLELKNIFWWRQNNGMAVYQDKNRGLRRVRFGTMGASDIGCIAGGDKEKKIRGSYVAIEIKKPSEYRFLINNYERIKLGNCKTKRDWHLFHQIGFVENVRDNGGIAFFTSDVKEVERIFKENGFIRRR